MTLRKEYLLVFSLLLVYPSILYNFLAPYHQLVVSLFVAGCLVANGFRMPKQVIIYLAFLMSATFQVFHLTYVDFNGIDIVFSSLLRLIFLFLLFAAYIYADEKFILKSISYVILVVLLCNTLSFLAVLAFDMSPFFSITLHDGRVAGFYIGSFSAVDMQFSEFRFLRGAGIFDEPGALGFVSFLLMVINYQYFRNLNFVIALYLLGVFSFSIAFIILGALYIILILPVRDSIRLAFPILVILSLLITILPQDKLDIIYHYSFGRIGALFDHSGDLVSSANSRAHVISVSTSMIQDNPWLGVGESLAYEISEYFSTASLVSYVAIFGVLGSVFYFMPFWVLSCREILQSSISIIDILTILLVLLLFFQRPYWDLPLNFILLYAVAKGFSLKKVGYD